MDVNAALRAFTRTVEKGSITGAARDLSVSQPAITKHLQNLERHVNARLLERSSRSVRPTPQGVALYENVRTALASIDAALEGVRRNTGEIDGNLRIFAPSCLGAQHLDRIIMEFQDEHPRVSVDLVLDNRHVDLVYENFDLSIQYSKPVHQDEIYRRIGFIERILVASPKYLEITGPLVSVDQLADLNIVTTSAVLSNHDVMTLMRDETLVEVRVRPILRTNNAQVLTRKLVQGRSVGPVQTVLVSEELSSGQLVRVLPEYHVKPTEVYLVYPSTRYMRPLVRAFAEFVVPKLREVKGVIKASISASDPA